jgi:hypothetical protein
MNVPTQRPDLAIRQPDNGVTKQQMRSQLPPNCLQQAEFQFTVWSAVIPNGLLPAQLLEPGFWAPEAPKLKPFDEIRARAEDGTWLARFVVVEVGRTWANLQQLELHNLGTKDVSLTKVAAQKLTEARKEFRVYHRGPKGWSVVRKSDKQVMHEGAATQAAAETWLDGHLKTTGAGEPVAATT